MEERLYTTHADCYDALYRELKDYEDEVTFILDQFKANSQTEGTRVLILGCGTGEHAKRLVAHGFDVLGIDACHRLRCRRLRTRQLFRSV